MQGSVIFIGVTLQCFVVVFGDYFSSIVVLEGLMETEKKLAETLTVYIQKEEERLASLKKHVEEIERLEWIKELSLETLYHPTSAYKFLKKSVYEFPSLDVIKNLTVNRNTSADVSKLLHNILHHPNEADLAGASKAILRLQDVYQLSAEKLIQGDVHGRQGTSLSARDCCDLGYFAMGNSDYYHALTWLWKCWQTAKSEGTIGGSNGVNLTRLYDHWAVAFYKQGNYERADMLGKELYKMDPKYVGLYHSIEKEPDKVSPSYGGTGETLPAFVNDAEPIESPEYEALCRGNFTMNETMRKDLSCYYKNDRDFLRYAPIKVELLHRDPHIYLFKQVVSDKEIHTLKEIAKPMLARARIEVLDEEPNKTAEEPEKHSEAVNHPGHDEEENDEEESDDSNEVSDVRTAQNAWFSDGENPVVERISKRAEDMTNLNLMYAEPLQMANYGLGGHYEPHWDHMSAYDYDETNNNTTTTKASKWDGDRIATLLFYNDAVFWHNLHLSGAANMDTEHAACPVLYGGKWVANKWISEKGNEFKRPCGLNKDDEDVLPYDTVQPHKM